MACRRGRGEQERKAGWAMGSDRFGTRRRIAFGLLGILLVSLGLAACASLPILGALTSETGQARDVTILYSGYVKGTLEPMPGCT